MPGSNACIRGRKSIHPLPKQPPTTNHHSIHTFTTAPHICMDIHVHVYMQVRTSTHVHLHMNLLAAGEIEPQLAVFWGSRFER
jgi:hypothetical protein